LPWPEAAAGACPLAQVVLYTERFSTWSSVGPRPGAAPPD